jgi:hypothetical protein
MMLPAATSFEALVTAWSSADEGMVTAGPDSDPLQETSEDVKAADVVFAELGEMSILAELQSQSIEGYQQQD